LAAIDIASDVVTGATALAGLMLVYLGAVGSAFASFVKTDQNAVRRRYQVRGWFAFVGIILAILAAGFALIGKWSGNVCIAGSAIALLLAALIFGAIAAFVAAWDIR
jgi:hypothetical protein